MALAQLGEVGETGSKLAALRLNHDPPFSTRQLSAATKAYGGYISFQRLSALQTGAAIPKQKEIDVLCRVLGCTAAELYPREAIRKMFGGQQPLAMPA